MRKMLLNILVLAAFSVCAYAQQSPAGLWKTVDDKTGQPRSLVRVYEENGKWFGKIEKSLNPNGRKVCDKCPDDRKNKPMVGLVVIRNLAKDGTEYSGGDIVDPDNGRIYKCKVWTTDGGKKLSVRGFIGFSLIGRSQTWTREAD
jgi:uncharacterized protein (DUF2147 family)